MNYTKLQNGNNRNNHLFTGIRPIVFEKLKQGLGKPVRRSVESVGGTKDHTVLQNPNKHIKEEVWTLVGKEVPRDEEEHFIR